MLFRYAYTNNQYFWHHFFLALGGVIGLIWVGVSDKHSFLCIVWLAIGFEMYQWIREGWKKHGVPAELNIEPGTPLYIKWQKKIFWMQLQK